MLEFVEVIECLVVIKLVVMIFGSVWVKEGMLFYELVEKMVCLFFDLGFLVIFGGGLGIMEVVNKGVFFGKLLLVGFNI